MHDILTLGDLYKELALKEVSRAFVEVPDSWEFFFDIEPGESEFHMRDKVYQMESVSAQKSVLKQLRAPYAFISSIPHELAQRNISELRARFSHPLVARVDTEKNAIVGVFSSKMSAVSDVEIVGHLIDAFGDHVPVTGGRLSYDSSSMDIRLRSGAVKAIGTLPNGAPDELAFMLDVSTSEACVHPVTVDFGVYRLACANGMRRRDMGAEYLKASYLRFSHDNFVSSMQAVASQTDVYLSSWFKKLKEAQEIDLGEPLKDGIFTEHFAAAIRRITSSRRFNVNLAAELVAKMELSGLGNTAYSLIQAVTQHAQSFEGKKRANMEAAAGYFLDDILEAV